MQITTRLRKKKCLWVFITQIITLFLWSGEIMEDFTPVSVE